MYPSMYPAYTSAYGAMPPVPSARTFDAAKARYAPKQRPAFVAIIGCLFVPCLLFTATFWLRSFEVRKSSDAVANVLCFILLLPILTFARMTWNLAGSGDPRPMGFLTLTSLAAWVVGFVAGGSNYTSFMRPYYDISNLNVYPNVDPARYVGSQLMDAGMIQFSKGTGLNLQKSLGFKNDDVYCVAPIVANGTGQSTFDFWAVGINCCSGHSADFACGEYTNPYARWGLRLMDDSKRDMFRLAVTQASATYNLTAPHPVFMYWMTDPVKEITAYQDDGFKFFMLAVFVSFAVQLFTVMCCLLVNAKI